MSILWTASSHHLCKMELRTYLHYTLHTCAIVINFAHMHAVYIYACMPGITGQLVSFIQDCYLGQAENTLQETASTFLVHWCHFQNLYYPIRSLETVILHNNIHHWLVWTMDTGPSHWVAILLKENKTCHNIWACAQPHTLSWHVFAHFNDYISMYIHTYIYTVYM